MRGRGFAAAATGLLLLPAAGQAQPATAPAPLRLEHLSADEVLALAGRLIDAGRYDEAEVLLDRLSADHAGGTEREFLDAMVALARKDYPKAERLFRAILAADPHLVRVRLELARTLFLAKKDEQADYQFRLAVAERPPEAVIRNVARYREAIRARRAWRIDVNFGLAPDSNINAATTKEQVELFGLPFRLDPDARAKSGVGVIAGGDASLRLLRDDPVPLYLAAYGRMIRYPDHDFDDYYLGGEAGPEFRVRGGRLRLAGTLLRRWYGGRTLLTSPGARLAYDKVVGGKLGLEGSLALRRDGYARRDDIDAWNLDATVAANRALGASTLGFAYAGVTRNLARERGFSSWSARLGGGVLKEIAWGLRPQLSVELGRQLGDAPQLPFGRSRRDWSLQASASIYKRDWNLAGFAPSIRVIWSRNLSTIGLYDQQRLRTEFGIAKAF